MNGSVYVGQKALSLTEYEKTAPISGVILWVDDENCYEAGDETGTVIEKDCPYASQEMANSLLATLQGYSYQGLEANGAKVSPIAELGDGLTVDGLYTQLAYQNIRFSTGEVMDVAAPGSDETLHEYKTEGQTTKQFTHQIAETKSLISKTSEEILLQVENELEGLSASFSVQLDSITSQITGLDGQMSSITQTVSSITSQITGINGEISSIEQTVSSITSRVSGLEGDYSSIEQYVDSLTLTVSNGSTSSTIQLKAGSTTISSQNITMSGLVTFTGLSNGTTTINGACIKTGTIDADRLNLTGAITFDDLSNSVRNDINDAYSMAEDAQSTANDTADTVGGWTYRGTTYIDGSSIMTGTVRASTLEGGEILLLDGNGDTAAYFTLEGASSYSGRALSIDSGAIAIQAQAGDIYLESGDGSAMQLSDTCRFTADISPNRAGSWSCGTSDRPWSDVYAENGTIQTSDENQKNSIEPLPEKYVAMLDQITPKRYKLNDGTSGRYHVGFIAQDVEQAMTLAGIDSTEFGGWIQDKDDEGNPIYMLRYNEFIAILWAKIQQLESRLEAMA